MDRGAWQAAVQGIAKSQTCLSHTYRQAYTRTHTTYVPQKSKAQMHVIRDCCLFYSVLYAKNFSRFPVNICIINGLLFICNSNLKMEEFEEGEGTIIFFLVFNCQFYCREINQAIKDTVVIYVYGLSAGGILKKHGNL